MIYVYFIQFQNCCRCFRFGFYVMFWIQLEIDISLTKNRYFYFNFLRATSTFAHKYNSLGNIFPEHIKNINIHFPSILSLFSFFA